MLRAAVVQLSANAMYEQGILAVPAFVFVLAVFAVREKRCPWRAAAGTVAASTMVAVVWIAAMIGSGYVSSRNPESLHAASVAPLSGLLRGLRAMWVGFVEHHVWRAIEFVRLGDAWVWDRDRIGLIAAIATLVLGALVGAAAFHWLWRDGGRPIANGQRGPGSPTFRKGLCIAALVGAYLAVLPVEFGYPNVWLFSRMLYLPGMFMGLAMALLWSETHTRSRWRAASIATAAVLWFSIVGRRYASDLRQGSDALRRTAHAVAAISPSAGALGVLIIAPSNVGTFSTSAVEGTSLRPAVIALGGADPRGPLYLAASCQAAEGPRSQVFDEQGRRVTGSPWAFVVEYRSGMTTSGRTLQKVCGSEPMFESEGSGR
jgi:hypothetical protein